MNNELEQRWASQRLLRETFVQDVEVHRSLPSTNDRARELSSRAGTALPSLIIAEEQTAGRGRGGNQWWSAPGALTFSLLVEPDRTWLPVSRWPEISLTVGSAVCLVLQVRCPGHDVQLKWPNDVFAAGRKACGILIEIPPQAPHLLVIGIGVNVNNSMANAPSGLQQKSVALCDLIGTSLDRIELLGELLRQLESLLEDLAESPERVRHLWRRFDLLSGRTLTLNPGKQRIHGTCAGIEDDGALLIRTEAGIQRFYGGVIEAFE